MEYLTQEDFEIAKKNGINYMAAYSRVYSYGWSIRDAITKPLKRKQDGLWPKYKELASKHGINQNTFYQRMKYRDLTPEEAATQPIMPSRFYGKRTITEELVQKAAKNGIKKGTLANRIYTRKWDPERAATQPVANNGRKVKV